VTGPAAGERGGPRALGRGRVAVSLTPLPLDADSRAFRIAGALADAGFRSVVVEGRASRNRFWGEALEVRALAAASERSGPRGGALRAGRFGPAGEMALYAAFRARDWWHHCRKPHGVVPAADLYYLHSFEFHRAVAPLAAAGAAPILYDAHDFYRGNDPPDKQPAFDRHRVRPFFDALEDRLVAAADAVVTVSDGVALLMERTFGRRPAVIRNCHDERADCAIKAGLRAALSLSPADRLCVAVGNRKPGMALAVAIEAFRRLPDNVHLAFVGRGYEADRDGLRGDPLEGRVHFGLSVAPNEVVPFIRSADLGLMVNEIYSENYRFALPNRFFQLVAAGLPLIRLALPEIEAIIGERPVGVRLDRLDPEALAAAVLDCSADAARLREASAALARELRWDVEATRLYRLIENVLPVRPGAVERVEARA
jgi:glycosyltransferase involved in cell wall biosynthesis